MWRAFIAMVSHIAVHDFNAESTSALHSLETPSIQCRTNPNNVLHAVQLPLLQKQYRSTDLEARSSSSASYGKAGQHIDARAALRKRLARENRQPQTRRQENDNTTTAASQEGETSTIVVSPSTNLGSESESGGSRSTASAGSSSKVLTTAASNDASSTEQASSASIAPTTPAPSPLSSLSGESDGSIRGSSTTMMESSAFTTASVAASPSQDSTLLPSTTQPDSIEPDSTARPSSTEAEREASVTSTRSFTESSSAVSTQITLATTTSIRTALASSSSSSALTTTTSVGTTSSGTPALPSTTSTSSGPISTSVPTSSVSSTRAPTSSVPSTASSTTSPSKTSTTAAWTSSTSKMTTTPSSLTETFSTTSRGRESPTSSAFSRTSTHTASSSHISTIARFPTSSLTSSFTPQTSSFPSTTGRGRWLSTSTSIAPITTTVVIFATPTSNKTTTTIETGALRTDLSRASGFAQNTGAIVSVALAAFVAFLCLLFCIFFACRRYRRRQPRDAYFDGIIHLAREVSWRRPVDGDDDDDSYLEKSHTQRKPFGSQSHSSEAMHDAFEKNSHGDQFSNSHGSAESTSATMVPMSTVFGGPACTPGLDHNSPQHPITFPPVAASPGHPSRSPTRTSSDAWRVPAGSYPHPYANDGGSRSAISLTLAGAPSRGNSSSSADSRKPYPKRKSLSGPRPMPSKTVRRHSSTPPSAFMGMRQSGSFDCERQERPSEQSDRLTMRSLISRLRTGRRTSTQSVATVRAPSSSAHGRESDESQAMPVTVPAFSPSLLNPPVMITPQRPILHFPRGVTGNSYTPTGAASAESSPENGPSAPVLWPPATLPTMAPSPSPTDNSSMIEYLLHPRLALGLARSEQASMASLRDHEDYSRPISGLVNNHIRSTTTLATHDTAESDQGGESVRS